jgi:Zn-dependent protease with chaperone function
VDSQPPLPQAAPSGSHLISRREVSPSWLLLYAATFALQALCAGFRAFVAYPTLWVAFTILGWPKAALHPLVLLIAYGPLALSLATLILPAGGWWWQQRIGARAPSERERLIYEEALRELTDQNPSLRPPRRWCVEDEPTPNAAVYADTLMLTRGLLESAYLTPVMAHELGHLNSSDGRLTAALLRMTTPPRHAVRKPLHTIAFITTGAIATWATRIPWSAYWRTREYAADTYAASLGQAQPLSMFLDTEALEHDLPLPFPWLHDRSHPPTEHRLDRIEHLHMTSHAHG